MMLPAHWLAVMHYSHLTDSFSSKHRENRTQRRVGTEWILKKNLPKWDSMCKKFNYKKCPYRRE